MTSVIEPIFSASNVTIAGAINVTIAPAIVTLLSGQALGYRKDLENHDFLNSVSLRLVSNAQTPVYADLPEINNTGWIKVDSQGGTSFCTGFSAAQLIELGEFYQTGNKVFQASAPFLYYQGQRLAGITGDNGCTMSAVVQTLTSYGVPSNSTFPFTGQYNPKALDRNDTAFSEAAKHKLNSIVKLTSVDQLYTFLASRVGGIYIALDWRTGHRDTRGVINSNTGSLIGGHAVALTGLSDRRDSQSRPYFWLTNSHGAQWGNRGHAEVAPAAVEQWLDTAYGFCRFSPFSKLRIESMI